MPVENDLLLILKSSELVPAEPDLGAKLMRSFLAMLLESGRLPQKIVCMGTAVFLTTEGSPVLDLMEKFAAAGAEIRTCGTCLEYYGRRDQIKVGSIGNMKETVAAMLSFGKVLAP
jgi:selenium metabolism protein YedF